MIGESELPHSASGEEKCDSESSGSTRSKSMLAFLLLCALQNAFCSNITSGKMLTPVFVYKTTSRSTRCRNAIISKAYSHRSAVPLEKGI